MIHPEKRAAKRRPIQAARNNSTGRAIQPDSGDIGRFGLGAVQGVRNRRAYRLPPLDRILLGPGRLRMVSGQLSGRESNRVPAGIEERGADALRTDIDAQEKRRADGGHRLVR